MKAMNTNTQNQLAVTHSIVFSFRFVVALRNGFHLLGSS
jgi:hypothetical protein